MIAISVQSGSNGNCIYVEAGDARLIFDAGISGRQASIRLEALGRRIESADAVIISHDHCDHIGSAGVYQRKFGLPIYVTRKTLDAACACRSLGTLTDVRHFQAGAPLRIRDAVVHTIPTPHDGADGVAFVVQAEGKRLGVLTDLGHVFDGLGDVVASLDAVFLESNYDPDMLANGPYPYPLQQRIKGPRGHLSNHESADLLAAAGANLKWACLAHLSEQNNHPTLAMRTHRRVLPSDFPLFVASRYESSNMPEV